MAKDSNTVSAVRAIAEPIAQRLGLEIWDIRFLKEGTGWFLRIFIDKDGKNEYIYFRIPDYAHRG